MCAGILQGLATIIEAKDLHFPAECSATGLAITADALGGIACAGIQDLAVTQHSRLGGGAVQPDEKTVQFWLNYHDDDVLVDAHVLAFLHLTLLMQEALAGLISAVFGRSTILTARIAAFEQMFGKAIAALREKSSEAAEILEQLGLIGLGA